MNNNEEKNPDFDLLEYVQEKALKEFHSKLWDSTENILRHHIDNPIVGELTKEKLRYANIMGIIYQDDEFPPKMEQTPGGDFKLTMTSNLLGIRQGDMLIAHNGLRIPVSEIPFKWYEERFIYDD